MSKPLTFGECLRAQRLAAVGQPPIVEVRPEPRQDMPVRPEPYAPPVVRPAPPQRSHIQREAAARLRELRGGS